MRLRLVFINPIGGIGGGERILLSIARTIQECRLPIDVGVVLLGDGALRAGLADLGVDVRVVPLPATAASFGDTSLRGASRLASLAALLNLTKNTAPSLFRFIRQVRSSLNDL